ncbi:sulfurtransferase [Corynebacterium breve]|uniref:Sulfurtransferase n=1 Tax=Corynebacterium breve TaxID=3049799 RepID=A0ABY8VEZ5_9CORY|nr:sulfurtransferase [Corynebacterium breve]WIM68221.1 sulfurtransferase [Corynebacterium breve]
MAVPFDPNPQFQEYSHPERLVSASWLSARLGTPGLKVVESDEDAFLYDIGHIPGAVRIDWRKDLNDPVTRDFIDGQAFAELMQARGISRDDTVVVYGDKSNWWAAYTLWVFELFGHPDVRLLDGGRDAWMGEERDMSFAVPEPAPSDYPAVERDDSTLRMLVDELKASKTSRTLVDVREKDEYTGTPATTAEALPALRHGHIPGAINIPWGGSVYPNARFRPKAEIAETYGELDPSQQTVVYCHLGDRSAHSWFVLKYMLGFKDVVNYDGSWSEWGNMVRMPIKQGEKP